MKMKQLMIGAVVCSVVLSLESEAEFLDKLKNDADSYIAI